MAGDKADTIATMIEEAGGKKSWIYIMLWVSCGVNSTGNPHIISIQITYFFIRF